MADVDTMTSIRTKEKEKKVGRLTVAPPAKRPTAFFFMCALAREESLRTQ